MPCCKKSGNKPVQKVVIPKGMINPGETTIIEIPSNLQKQPIVVAKRKTSVESCNYGQPMYAQRANKTSSKNRSKDKNYQSNNNNRGNQGSGRSRDRSAATSKDLESTERKERDQFLKDLEEFQRARRKLLSNASFLAGRDNPGNQRK